MRNASSLSLLQFARKLPARYLALITFGLFLVDLLVPDLIPFADGLLLALLTLVFGASSKTENPASIPLPIVRTRA
jgi:hypothetical protein